tara:strand:+ start:4395 stop:4730 length:336 start_codon:yes stop_codon:yes gene_type:complete
MGLFHKLGHKSKDVGNRLGHKIKRGVHHTGKFIKPAIVLGTAALALHQATKPARETRTARNQGERIMAAHRDTEHKFQMERIDPGGVAKKRLDEFVATKPFEAAFDFDAPF